MKKIIENSLAKAISYTEYRTLINDLLKEKKATGSNQSEDLYNYSLLNEKRMKRLDKTIKLINSTIEALAKINTPQTWLLLTEGWCGDAAQNVPILQKIAEASNQINLQIILRDENSELMDLFLTNGGKAIPKLIALDTDKNILFTWGPRPSIATKLIMDYKAKNGVVDATIKQELQVWYNKNKGVNLQEDIISLL